MDHAHLTAEVGGISALKTEWEAWWQQLLKAHPQMSPELSPPGFRSFANSPALRKVLQAHFGAALTWARERRAEYAELEAERKAGIWTESVSGRRAARPLKESGLNTQHEE